MTVNIVNMEGKAVGTANLPEKIFGAPINEALVHMAVNVQLANRRQGTQSTLTRSEVSGGGKKPWRQKGTGRARQGSTRSPQWTHGGVALAPKPRSYRIGMNKKAKRAALCSVLSDKAANANIIVVDAITADEYKTKAMIRFLSNIGADGKSLVILGSLDRKVIGSIDNIPTAKTAQVNTINVYDIVNSDKLVIASSALAALEEGYG